MVPDLMTLLATLGPLHWWALAAILIGLEMVMPTQYMLWPGLAAILTGIIVLLSPSLDWTWQALAFALFTGAFVLSARYWPRAAVQDEGRARLNQRVHAYVGRQAVVAEAFEGARGTIVLDDTRWQAESLDGKPLADRTVVEIVGYDGPLLKVKPIG